MYLRLLVTVDERASHSAAMTGVLWTVAEDQSDVGKRRGQRRVVDNNEICTQERIVVMGLRGVNGGKEKIPVRRTSETLRQAFSIIAPDLWCSAWMLCTPHTHTSRPAIIDQSIDRLYSTVYSFNCSSTHLLHPIQINPKRLCK